MPTVPRYDGPQVQDRAISGNRTAELNPGMTPGAGFSRVGNVVADVASKAKADADQLAIMEADKKLTEIETDLLYNPESGALNRRGKDSFGAQNEVGEAYGKSIEEIEKSLSNPVQKQKFKQIASERGLNINRALDKHVAGEIKAYDDNETLAYVQTQMNAAITGYQDPDKVAQAIEAQKIAIRSHSERNGLPEEFANNKIALAESKTHAAVISRYVDNGDDLAAENYFKQVKGSITGDELAKVEKELEISSRLGFAQREADKIMKQGVSASQAYELAKQVEDPKKRQALNEEISRQFTVKKQAEHQDQEDLHLNVKNLLYQNGGNINDPKIQRALTRMNPSQDENTRTLADKIRSGKGVSTDRQYWMDMNELAVNNPDKFKDIVLNDPSVTSRLATNDWDKLLKIQNDLKKGKASKELKTFATDNEYATRALNDMKIKSTSPKGAEFKNKFTMALSDFRDMNGRNPNDKEMYELTKQLSKEVVVGSAFFGMWEKKKRLFEATDEEQQQAFTAQAEKNKGIFTSAASGKPSKIRDKKTGRILTLNKKTGLYE